MCIYIYIDVCVYLSLYIFTYIFIKLFLYLHVNNIYIYIYVYLFFIYMYIGKIGVLDSVFCKTKCFGHSVFGRKLSRTLLVHWKLFNIDLEFVSRIYLWILNQVVLRSRNKNWITPTPCTKLINVLIVFNQKTHWLMVLVVYIYIYLFI